MFKVCSTDMYSVTAVDSGGVCTNTTIHDVDVSTTTSSLI